MELNLQTINKLTKGKFSDLLGIEVTALEHGKCIATMQVEGRHHQPMGVLHGGVSVTLAETVASIGGWFIAAKTNQVVVGQEINANHLKQVTSGTIRAEATILHQGRQSQVWEILLRNDLDQLFCVSRCTLAVISPR